MAQRLPSPDILLLMMLVSLGLFLGLSAWDCGGWSALFAHPARAAACVYIVLLSVVALFSGINLRGFKRPNVRGRWLIAPVALLSLAVAGLPAYTDRRHIATIDGDAVRYLGLVLLIVGGVLRVVPMFVLGSRFT